MLYSHHFIFLLFLLEKNVEIKRNLVFLGANKLKQNLSLNAFNVSSSWWTNILLFSLKFPNQVDHDFFKLLLLGRTILPLNSTINFCMENWEGGGNWVSFLAKLQPCFCQVKIIVPTVGIFDLKRNCMGCGRSSWHQCLKFCFEKF